jgi:thymidylate synthase (FAD)
VSEDTGLIRYLLRHQHTTPFEMVEFKFHCVMHILIFLYPITIFHLHYTAMFIARQWIRHRTANVNEYSARYSVVRDRFYHPSISDIRKQSTNNRQGGDEVLDEQVSLLLSISLMQSTL